MASAVFCCPFKYFSKSRLYHLVDNLPVCATAIYLAQRRRARSTHRQPRAGRRRPPAPRAAPRPAKGYGRAGSGGPCPGGPVPTGVRAGARDGPTRRAGLRSGPPGAGPAQGTEGSPPRQPPRVQGARPETTADGQPAACLGG